MSMQNTMQNMQNTMQSIQNALQDMQDTMNQRFDAVDQRFDSLDARFENVGRRAQNLTSTSQTGVNAQLIPLVKERPGLGPVLPGNFEPIVIDDRPLQVGDLLRQRFPPTVEDMFILTHTEINFLSQMHNNSFRIVGTDGIETRRRKFRDFVVYG